MESRTNWRADPLKIALGALLQRVQIPAIGAAAGVEAGELQDLLRQVYLKEPPFNLDVAHEPAYLRPLKNVRPEGPNPWRNGIGSQKGIGCFATTAELHDPAFRHLDRPQCPHRQLVVADNDYYCQLSPNGGTRCRSEQQSAGEAPKVLQITDEGGGTYAYRLAMPTELDLIKLRNDPVPLPAWPLIVSLYSGSRYMARGRKSISLREFREDLGLDQMTLGALANPDPHSPGNTRFLSLMEPYLIVALRRHLYEREFVISLPDLINFYLSLKPRGFLILAGVSGTGKSRLPHLVSELIRRDADDNNFLRVPIRPSWNDVSDLFGYYNSLRGVFEQGPVVDAFDRAERAEDEDGRYANWLVLDELNLARVEHYFADFLSAMENQDEVNGRTGVIRISAGEREAVFPIPDNLFVVGTINIDESTHGISHKVLDRANTIEFDQVHFRMTPPAEPVGWEDAELHLLAHHLVDRHYRTFGQARAGRRMVVDLNYHRLEKLYEILKPWRLHFGYRTIEEICIYMGYAADFVAQAALSGVDIEEYNLQRALDYQILQKVLPRITGTREELEREISGKRLFVELERVLEEWGCEKSLEKTRRMRTQEIVNFWEA